MTRIKAAEYKHYLLSEIQACVQIHLRGLRSSWSPRGLWHLVLRRIASRRIKGILNRIRSDEV
jgi:hypothetical protein